MTLREQVMILRRLAENIHMSSAEDAKPLWEKYNRGTMLVFIELSDDWLKQQREIEHLRGVLSSSQESER